MDTSFVWEFMSETNVIEGNKVEQDLFGEMKRWIDKERLKECRRE